MLILLLSTPGCCEGAIPHLSPGPSPCLTFGQPRVTLPGHKGHGIPHSPSLSVLRQTDTAALPRDGGSNLAAGAKLP